jgi:hypothetical protein
VSCANTGDAAATTPRAPAPTAKAINRFMAFLLS